MIPQNQILNKYLFQDQEKVDGVTSTGKAVTDPTSNDKGQKCAKCGVVGESLLVCTVSLIKLFCVRGINWSSLGTFQLEAPPTPHQTSLFLSLLAALFLHLSDNNSVIIAGLRESCLLLGRLPA